MRRILGFILLAPGAWALVAPQANLGLPELRWMARNSFPGEALIGAAIVGLAYYFIGEVPAGTGRKIRQLFPNADDYVRAKKNVKESRSSTGTAR